VRGTFRSKDDRGAAVCSPTFGGFILKNIEDSHIHQLELNIDYNYADKRNAFQAVTHSSYAYEHRQEGINSNERLEFLGDSVLSFIITNRLYKEISDMPEGEMSKLRASVVSEASLSQCAHRINLGEVLLLGKGEEMMGGRQRSSILADAMEAVIGSLYLDGGLAASERFVDMFLHENYLKAIKGTLFSDNKTKLQEEIQKKGNYTIQYTVVQEKGPDHNKVFTTSVSVNTRILGEGTGKTKKEAEQNAAGNALEKLPDDLNL
jgi:ribonuclease-3